MLRTLLISALLTSTALADTWTVDDDGKADFDNIQAAVNAASDGDEILVMPGTYTSTQGHVINSLGKSIWLHSLLGSQVTIIDGEFSRRGIGCFNGENSNTIIEGFTIRDCVNIPFDYDGDGDADEYWDSQLGGGLIVRYSNPTLKACVFDSNESSSAGGGGSLFFSDANILNCEFINNYADAYGGGLHCYSGNPSLNNCLFESNSVSIQGLGGALYNAYSNNSIFECIITKNYKGIYTHSSNSEQDPLLTNSILCSNSEYQITGDYVDGGGNSITTNCINQDCPDINGDGYVNVSDLLVVIDQWGLTDSPADLNFDGIVDVTDLLIVVGNWGPCE